MNKEILTLVDNIQHGKLAPTIASSARIVWLSGLGIYSLTKMGREQALETLTREARSVQSTVLTLVENKVTEVARRAFALQDQVEQAIIGRAVDSLSLLTTPTAANDDDLVRWFGT